MDDVYVAFPSTSYRHLDDAPIYLDNVDSRPPGISAEFSPLGSINAPRARERGAGVGLDDEDDREDMLGASYDWQDTHVYGTGLCSIRDIEKRRGRWSRLAETKPRMRRCMQCRPIAACCGQRTGAQRWWYACRACAAFWIPVLIAVAVFAPWYGLAIAPDVALRGRTHSAECAVVNHTIVDVRIDRDRLYLLYLPGLDVRFAMADDRGHETGINATALASLKRASSWMGAEVAKHFFALHPVGSATTCHFDSDDPTHRVALRGEIDGLTESIVLCSVASFVLFCAALIIAAGYI